MKSANRFQPLRSPARFTFQTGGASGTEADDRVCAYAVQERIEAAMAGWIGESRVFGVAAPIRCAPDELRERSNLNF